MSGLRIAFFGSIALDDFSTGSVDNVAQLSASLVMD